ncbi:MAG TPA: penicillin-binding protein 2 [Pseudomonadales bacterium]|nr:penicillin-binding protein 2 [Pseudomonadales bacterium]|tara:strand:- start:2956 stop:4848 length:1893 start_codon:yes stop_codon:yes gene_type:complete
MAEPLVLKDHSAEAEIFYERVAIGFGILIVLTLFLVGRLFYLQIIQHDIYRTRSDDNRIHVQSIPPIRGLIFDRNGVLIADNIPTFNLTIIKERVEDIDKTLATIGSLIPLSDSEIKAFQQRLKRRQRPFESTPIKLKLTEREKARIAVNRYALPGVQVEARLVRHYPMGALMAHAVGSVRRINEDDLQKLDSITYSGTDHIGKIGIEKFYERSLLGEVGYQEVETNARGQVMKELSGTPPKPGNNLTMHVDTNLQRAASEALGDRRGSVVAIDPNSGGILAMVSKPSYDPNLFVTGIEYQTYAELRDSEDVPLFNRAVQGQYEPGSTLKPFLALAGLLSGVITPDYSVKDPGWFKLPNNQRLYRDWNWTKKGTGGHGVVNLDKAIYRSCNVYFYELAVKLGIERIHDHLTKFGFGSDMSYDLPEAHDGLVPSRAWKERVRQESWYPGDTVNIGIGQGDLLVTPLQLATAVSVLANRGRWVQPRMLKESSLYTLPASRSRLLPNIAEGDDAAWDIVIQSMEKVVHRGNMGFGENGTAWAHIGQDIEYRMAGKSGTAQVVTIEQGEEYNEEEVDERLRKHAWFVAFAPVQKPEIALAVLVENGGGGSAIAAPVARKMLDEYLLKPNRISKR